MTAAGVLLSRLLPPRLPPGCLSRDDLVGRLVAGLSGCRLVSVLAGAGYGKSTLLAQALARSRLPWVWCSCDDRLASPTLLLAHIGAGIAQRFPGFGAKLELEGPAEDQVIALCNEVVQTIPDEFVLVLDDVHTVQGEAAETLHLVIRSLPPTVHLALAGRAPLPFPLGRLRAAGVLEIGESDLQLSEEEAAELVSLVGLTVEPDALSELHRRTEGWVAGLVLGAQSARGLNGAEELAQVHLFEYLAEEVLLRQEPEIQGFLLDTALLERFTPAVAASVAGVPNGGVQDPSYPHLTGPLSSVMKGTNMDMLQLHDSAGRRPQRAARFDRDAEGATATDWSTVPMGGWDEYRLARARAFAHLRSQSAAFSLEAEDG